MGSSVEIVVLFVAAVAFLASCAALAVASYSVLKIRAENLRLENELRKQTIEIINQNNIELTNAIQGNVIDLVQNLHEQGPSGTAAKGLEKFSFNQL